MIKILFFIETLEGGGAEKVLRNLVNNMNQTQFDITVQTVWPCDFEKYLKEGIKHKSMYSARNKLNAMRYRIEAETGLAYKLHVKGDYDIECAYLEAGATKVMAASINKKAKKLAWVHCDLQRAVSDPEAFVEKTKPCYEKFDKVLCVSENVKDSFLELFGDTVPAEVLYNTIDDGEIRDKAQMPLIEKKRRFTVVTLGRLTEQKGYDRLLRVHNRLMAEGFEYDLWILGEGPDRPVLEQYVKENGLEDTVRLFGFVDNPYPFIREADLLVCSSRWEGLSTFVTEGLIIGRPVVTTDCTGMRELLGDSEYGLITESSENGLYEGMKTMLRDESLRKHFEDKAAARGMNFSSKAIAEKTEALFEKTVGESDET